MDLSLSEDDRVDHRRIYSRRNVELKKYGLVQGCPGGDAARLNQTAKAHAQMSRNRVEKAMEGGDARRQRPTAAVGRKKPAPPDSISAAISSASDARAARLGARHMQQSHSSLCFTLWESREGRHCAVGRPPLPTSWNRADVRPWNWCGCDQRHAMMSRFLRHWGAGDDGTLWICLLMLWNRIYQRSAVRLSHVVLQGRGLEHVVDSGTCRAVACSGNIQSCNHASVFIVVMVAEGDAGLVWLHMATPMRLRKYQS